jgi:DNA-binding NtrC family response regulator
MGRILIVDDEPNMREPLASQLRLDGHEISEAVSADEARSNLLASDFDALLTGQKMSDREGLTVLKAVRESDPSISVVLLTAAASRELGLESLRQGAFDFLTMPLQPELLSAVARRACEHTALRRENLFLQETVARLEGGAEFYGDGPAVRELREKIARVAATDAPVLITGETGTGKELVARAIHRNSPRADRPFLALNCAALSETLLENKLFGRENTAFAEADRACPGLIEAAHEGTLFLDEAGEISPGLQAKLLPIVADGRLSVASATPRVVNVRVLVATRRDLEQRVRDGLFREDLYDRLAAAPIRVPPLRDRLEEIPGLCDSLSRQVASELRLPVRAISGKAVENLKRYPFPGNVRELKNLIERAYMLARNQEIGPEDFPLPERVAVGANPGGHFARAVDLAPMEKLPQPFDLSAFLDQTEKDLIVRTLASTGGAQAEAARRLGLSRSALAYKLTKYGIRGTSSVN